MSATCVALLLDQSKLTIDEVTLCCGVGRDWVVEHVQAGVLLEEPQHDPGAWTFSSADLIRAQRLLRLERDFDANPELAGLVADLVDELDAMRGRLRRAGISYD